MPKSFQFRKIVACLLFFAHTQPLAAEAPDDASVIGIRGQTMALNRGAGGSILLRGVNAGGLFVYEPWMSPMAAAESADDQWQLERILRERFGDARARELLGVWQANWFGSADCERLAARGMNCVRLPIWYGMFEDDEGNPRDGFPQLDAVIAAAWQHGIYSIIDLHGAFGGQSGPDNHTAARREARPMFWDGAESLVPGGAPLERQPIHVERAAILWERIARYYADNPAIAGYDLLNEPLGAPSRAILLATYDRLYRAVRRVDPQRPIFVEACWSGHDTDPAGRARKIHWELDVLEDPAKLGWSNVVYSLHQYGAGVQSIDDRLTDIDRHAHWGVPVHIGEFNTYGDTAAFIHAVTEFDRRGIHWNMWNFKAVRATPPAGTAANTDSWGLWNLPPNSPLWGARADLHHDSEDMIRKKWRSFATASFVSNPELERVFPIRTP